MTKNRISIFDNIQKFIKKLFFSACGTMFLARLFYRVDTFYLSIFFTLFLASILFIFFKFFMKKMIDKSLEKIDFLYVKKAFLIIHKDLLFLFISSFLLILYAKNLFAYVDLTDNKSIIIFLKTAVRDPIYLGFCTGFAIFSYRGKILLSRLLHLQGTCKRKST